MSRIYELLSLSEDKDKKDQVRLLNEEKIEAHPGIFELPEALIDRNPESLKEFEALLRNLLILSASNPKSLMICSAESNSGASTVALNLGILMARRLEYPCLLVEANLFSPGLYRYQKGKPCEGLCQLLEEQRPAESHILPTTEPRLFAMGVGVPGTDRVRIFHPSLVENVLSRLKAAYRTVIIDGPPVLKAGQSLQLARYVDGVMLIVRTGTLAEHLRRAVGYLEEQQVKILGLVMNTR